MSKQNNKSKPSHKFDIGGDFGISGTLQFVNGLASNSKERKANEETYNNAIDNTRIGFNGISSLNNYDSLEDYLNSAGQLHELETSDLIGNNAHRIGKFLSTSSQAMQAGSNFGPWGALAGAVVGQIGAGISGWRNRKKAERSLADINQKIRDTNALQTAMVDNKLNNIMANQMADQQWDYIAALGGNLHSNSTTWSNGLNYIGSGGSHESNPNDGVAISTAPDGLQNKVEEGEVVWNDDYVFSRRLKVPKKDLEKNKWKGETYADIAKKLMDESAERPNDPITLRGLDDSLSRLKDSQEELKAKQEGNKIKKEIASMPPELLAQMQQAQQQPTEEEMMQQQAMEQMPQEQMPMVDPSMQQPTMEQPPMYAEGGHLLRYAGNVKAVSGKGFFTPLPQPQMERIGSNQTLPSMSEVNAVKNAALTDYINRQSEYVNVKDAQKYGGFYNNIDKVNEYLNGNTPMDVNNIAQGVANQQSRESGRVYLGRVPVKKNYGLDENSRILDRDSAASVKFFLKKNRNLNLDSDAIYFYSKDKNDEADKNKFLKADKVDQEIYDKNSVENVSRISGIDFDRSHAKGGHLFFGGGNGLGVNIDYSTGHSPINSYRSQRPFSVYGNNLQQTFNPTDVVSTDMAGKYGSVGQNIQANNNGFSNPTLQGKSKGVSNSGFNKGAMFGALASGIDMTGAIIDNVWGNSGGNLDALYKGKRDNKDLPNWLTTAWNGYTGGLYAKGGHLYSGKSEYDQWLDLVRLANTKTRLDNRVEEEVEDENEADILNDRSLLLRAKEKYYPKSLTRDERKELRQIKKSEKEPKEHNWNFDETGLRYAPVLGSIFNVARSIASRPDYGNPERIERAAARVGAQVSPKYIGDYLQYKPLDESYYLNQLNAQQNAANNAIVGLSNGNRSMALASMLANDYNYNNQRGAAYRQGLEYNDVNRLRFGEFNRGTNQFNAQQYLSAAAQSAQNRAQAANLIASAAQMREGIDNAYGASQSANWTSLFNNLGAVGKDRMNWNMAKDIYDYQTGRNGEVKYKPAAKGGYLTIKTNNRRKG